MSGGLWLRILNDVLIQEKFYSVNFFGPLSEMLTSVTPLSCHFYNIFRSRRYAYLLFLRLFFSLTSRRKMCNAGKRMKWSVVLSILQFNVLFVSLALFSTTMSPLATLARAAAWAAALNFGFVALAIVSPLLQLVYQLFQLQHHAPLPIGPSLPPQCGNDWHSLQHHPCGPPCCTRDTTWMQGGRTR